MFEAMLQGEMNSHLGYDTNDHGYKETSTRRNGYTHKSIKNSMGEVEIDSPRDRDGAFDPQLIPKRSKDVSGIEDKVLSMYAKGMSQRDIADTIEDIYDLIIADPANYLKYYIGYVEFLELKRDAVKQWGKGFSQEKFHKAVLDVGPAPFDVVREQVLGE